MLQTKSLCCSFSATVRAKNPQQIIITVLRISAETLAKWNTSKIQLSDPGEDYCLVHAQAQWILGRVNDMPSKQAGRRPVESNRGLEGLPAHLHTPQSL